MLNPIILDAADPISMGGIVIWEAVKYIFPIVIAGIVIVKLVQLWKNHKNDQ